MAYEQIEGPVGSPQRLEYMIASLMALTANINRDPKRQAKPFTAADFMPQWGAGHSSQRERTPEEMLALVKEANARFGGRES